MQLLQNHADNEDQCYHADHTANAYHVDHIDNAYYKDHTSDTGLADITDNADRTGNKAQADPKEIAVHAHHRVM